MRVLVVEPWLAGSHRAWAEGYRAASRNDVAVVSMDASGWKWRLRASAAPLARQVEATVREAGQWPDAMIVSGLVDVSSFLGHLRAPRGLPVVTYMHESQLVYPTADGNVDGEAVQRNWDSWLAADAVWFNSRFHLDAVVDALPRWLASRPDAVDPTTVERVTSTFEVHPVGVDAPGSSRSRGRDRQEAARPRILWPHRWEPDKAPDVFARAIDKLAAAGVEFGLVLAGEDPAGSSVKSDLVDRHRDRVDAVGPFDRSDYIGWLGRSDIVVSCAQHEFFGVAVVEAALAGCVPVLPHDLSYPELIPERMWPCVLYPRGRFGSRLLHVIGELSAHREAVADLPDALTTLAWDVVAADYDDRLDELVARSDVVSRRC